MTLANFIFCVRTTTLKASSNFSDLNNKIYLTPIVLIACVGISRRNTYLICCDNLHKYLRRQSILQKTVFRLYRRFSIPIVETCWYPWIYCPYKCHDTNYITSSTNRLDWMNERHSRFSTNIYKTLTAENDWQVKYASCQRNLLPFQLSHSVVM